jgi:hypothetical protein
MKTIANSEPLKGVASQEPFTITWDRERGKETAYPADLIRFFISQMPTEGMTLLEARHGAKVLDAVTNAPHDTVSLEDADYDWLRRVVTDHAARLFGVSAVLLDDILKLADGTRAERRRRRKKA